MTSTTSSLHPPLLSPLLLEHTLSFVAPILFLFLLLVYIPYKVLSWCYTRLLSLVVVAIKKKLPPDDANVNVTSSDKEATTTTSDSTDSGGHTTTNRKNRISWLILLAIYGALPVLDDYYHRLNCGWFSTSSSSSSGSTSTYTYTSTGVISSGTNGNSIGLYDLIHGTEYDKLHEIFQRVPKLLQGPKVPWFSLISNRHLQFVPWLIQNEIHLRYYPVPYQTVTVNVTDCLDKTIPNCQAHPLMEDSITLDIFPPLLHTDVEEQGDDNSQQQEEGGGGYDDVDVEDDDASSNWNRGFNSSSPIILFAPGLTCSSQDLPGTSIIRLAYKAGFRSIVVNRRGHAKFATTTSSDDAKKKLLTAPRFNILGDIDDMEQVYHYVKHHPMIGEDTPMFLYGVSAGTAITVSGLSKWDRQKRMLQQQQQQDQGQQFEEDLDARSPYANYTVNEYHQELQASELLPTYSPPSFVASVAISPGYDCSKVFEPERFLFPYNPFLLKSATNHFITQNEDVLRAHDTHAVDKAMNAATLQELLDATSVFTGYKNSTLYHQHTNPINKLHDITTPKLVLNSYDDPCCNVRNLYEQSPYENHDNKTYATMVTESLHGIIAVTKYGSHCPFLDTSVAAVTTPTAATTQSDHSNSRGFLSSLITTLFPSLVYDPISNGYMLNSWADHVTIEYFRAALDVYT